MNELHIYEDLDRFDEVFGDLDLTMLYSGEKHRVFVYGTLMTGMHNHFRLNNTGVRLLTKLDGANGAFEMRTRITNAGYPAPVVITEGEQENQIRGEVYEVSNQMLITLDRLEGHPEVYRRETVRVGYTTLPGEQWASENMWMYIYVDEIPNPESTEGIRIYRNDDVGQVSDNVVYQWVGACRGRCKSCCSWPA